MHVPRTSLHRQGAILQEIPPPHTRLAPHPLAAAPGAYRVRGGSSIESLLTHLRHRRRRARCVACVLASTRRQSTTSMQAQRPSTWSLLLATRVRCAAAASHSRPHSLSPPRATVKTLLWSGQLDAAATDRILSNLGVAIARLHCADLVHMDLTTSNMSVIVATLPLASLLLTSSPPAGWSARRPRTL